MTTHLIQIQTTVSTEEEAPLLAQGLVAEKLAACVQITSCRSIYRWEECISEDTEWLCLIKTTELNYDKVECFLKEHHSYDTPEIIALPICHMSSDYGQWLDDNVMS